MDKKIIASVTIISLVILVGGYLLVSRQGEARNKALMGQAIGDTAPGIHVARGKKEPAYASDPPTSGRHWDDTTAGGGIHEVAKPDEAYVHSMEHGAAIVWYKSDLPKETVNRVITAYNNSSSAKKIAVPRSSLDVPVALTSWGRLLKLKEINEKSLKTITQFLDTNSYHAPEDAPI